MRRQPSHHNFLEWLLHNVTDSTTSEEVLTHLGHTLGNSFPEIATVVYQTGHKKLALAVLDHELEESKQVETLLQWSENTVAFMKAVESGNPDLIYMVMLKLQDGMAFDKFISMVRNFPIATTLYKKYCMEFDKRHLFEVHVQENNFVAQAQDFLIEALDDENRKDSLLTSATKAYRSSGDNFTAALCEEQLKLTVLQQKLKITGKSVHETCALLLKSHDLKIAEDFRNEYKIPERRFWWLRIRSLAELDHWACLEKLSKDKKCPLGYEAFVEVCLENNNKEEALRYLAKVGKKLKMKYYIKAGCLEVAAKMAVTKKDISTLMRVRRMCKPGTASAETIDSLLAKLDHANRQIWHSFSL